METRFSKMMQNETRAKKSKIDEIRKMRMSQKIAKKLSKGCKNQ